MMIYVLFVLRALLTGRPMPADEAIADWAGVRRQALVLSRQRPGFFEWSRYRAVLDACRQFR